MVDAAAQAAQHLTDVGYLPLFDRPTLAAMRSGHHKLVDRLCGDYELAGGDAA